MKKVKIHINQQIFWKKGHSFTEIYIKESRLQEYGIDDHLDGIHTNKVLSDIDVNICEGLKLEEECLNVLNKMSQNKSPCYDGLTNEFYQHFWDYVKEFVVECFNEAFKQGKLSEMHK